jgi:hypothetical protein
VNLSQNRPPGNFTVMDLVRATIERYVKLTDAEWAEV